MNKKDSSQEHGSLSDVLAEDNAIDRIALGEHYEDADQLLALLACARAEVDKDIPAPPVMADLLGQDFYTEEFHTQEFQAQSAESDAPVPLTSRRSGVFRRSASTAIAAGGASISAMLTAGGVAAALAVGGLGYVAYTKSQVEETQAPTESMEPSTATNGQRTLLRLRLVASKNQRSPPSRTALPRLRRVWPRKPRAQPRW